MDLSTIQSAIATLGFPIVCVIAMGWFIWKLWTRFQEQNEKREEKLYAVIISAQAQNDALSKTNSQFVAVLEQYQKDLEGIKDDVTIIKTQLQK